MSRPSGDSFSLLRALARPPESAWPDGLVHHGARLVLLVACGVLLTVLFPPERRMQFSRYALGTVADENIQAMVPFDVPKSSDELAQQRDDARASIPPTFDFRPEAADSMAARLNRFFARVDSAVRSGSPAALAAVLDRHSVPLTGEQRALLRDPDTFDEIRGAALEGAREILARGVADGAQLQEYETRTITVRRGDQEISVDRDGVMTPREFYDSTVARLPASASPDVQQTLRVILIQFMDQSLELNVRATESDRESAARAVSRVGDRVLKDQVIVRAGDPITPEDLQELRAYQEQLRDEGLLEEGGVDLSPLFGGWLVNTLVLGVFGLLLYFFRREVYQNPRWVSLMALLAVAFFGATALVASYGLAYELIPIAFVALPVAVLWDGRMALVLAMVLAVAVSIQPPFAPRTIEVVAMTLLGGAAAALSVRAVRRRAQAWVFGAIVFGAYGVTVAALALAGAKAAGDVPASLGWAGLNAVFSAILAMGFVPVFEWFTGITTDQTLLEWADPNRELLKRLSMEAPGTYAHTINVANLAEAAASVIGANGLLCRVGLYYHDVGKMLKPHYFVENQPDGRNPHDRLKPDTSAAIVKEHVTEGYKMAREAGVPDVVAAFITEHHGNQRIGFFWEKAKEEYGEEALDPEDFRYPGPRPRSKETAIAMLADSAESATRALQDPTPERVRDLIQSIVDAKIADRQLDEAPVTLGEIGRIKDQFVKVLSGIYHHRIDYPQTKHLTEKRGGEETGPGEGSGGAKGGAGGGGGSGAGEDGGGRVDGGGTPRSEDTPRLEGGGADDPDADGNNTPSGPTREPGPEA